MFSPSARVTTWAAAWSSARWQSGEWRGRCAPAPTRSPPFRVSPPSPPDRALLAHAECAEHLIEHVLLVHCPNERLKKASSAVQMHGGIRGRKCGPVDAVLQ